MDGHQYEQKCAQYLREQGYTNVTVTRGSGDQGVDITAMKDGKKYAIQCKYYEGNVGNKAIQEVYAGAAFYNCSVAMVITNSFFTKSAKELAQKLKVILVEDINAIKLMESSRTAKPKGSPKPAQKVPSQEERFESQYQDMVRRFPGNPKVDAEISEYVQKKRSHIDNIVHQARQDHRKVSGRGRAYVGDGDPKKAVMKECMDLLQEEVDEIDGCGRDWLEAGISEASAQKLVDIIVGTAELGRKILEQYELGHTAYKYAPSYDVNWAALRDVLPSVLIGPEIQSIHKEAAHQQEAVLLQQEQIKELEHKLAGREGVLAELRKVSEQKTAEIDACKRKIEKNRSDQDAELAPLDQQLELINGQLRQRTGEKNRLKKEKKSCPLLACGQRSTLRQQIRECSAKIGSLEDQTRNYKQHRETIVARYSKLEEEVRSTMNAAALERQRTEDQICLLQQDIRDQLTEKKLNTLRCFLEKMLKDAHELETKAKAARAAYWGKKYKWKQNLHSDEVDDLIRRRGRVRHRG